MLTVEQVNKLHQALETARSRFDRAAAAYLLLALYGRCRHGDLQFVHEIGLDFSGLAGFMQVTTNRHKTVRAAKKLSELLYVLIPAQGEKKEPWLQLDVAFDALLSIALKCLDRIQAPLFRPPTDEVASDLCRRGISSKEASRMLRHLLHLEEPTGRDEPAVSSHSLKATPLTWADRYGLNRIKIQWRPVRLCTLEILQRILRASWPRCCVRSPLESLILRQSTGTFSGRQQAPSRYRSTCRLQKWRL